MTVSRIGGVLAVAAACVVVVSGCAAEPGSTSSNGAPNISEDSSSVSLSTESIISAIEPHGLVCEQKEPRGKDREETIECRGDDYLFITATRLSSVETLNKQIDLAKKTLCENEVADGFRRAVSDTWILVPGSERDTDVATFEKAMSDLGLEPIEDPC